MGKTRVCGKTCHDARGSKCRCWCGGMFHGRDGEADREEFCEVFDVPHVPTTERAFRELTGQPSLFADVTAGDEWRARRDAAAADANGGKR